MGRRLNGRAAELPRPAPELQVPAPELQVPAPELQVPAAELLVSAPELQVSAAELLGPAFRRPLLDQAAGFSQTETCEELSVVNGSRFQPAQRSRNRSPAS
jgi:hypothetical protein